MRALGKRDEVRNTRYEVEESAQWSEGSGKCSVLSAQGTKNREQRKVVSDQWSEGREQKTKKSGQGTENRKLITDNR